MGIKLNTHFFRKSESRSCPRKTIFQLKKNPASRSAKLRYALRNQNGEIQSVSNIYLEIGTIPLEEQSIPKQPTAKNQFEITTAFS